MAKSNPAATKSTSSQKDSVTKAAPQNSKPTETSTSDTLVKPANEQISSAKQPSRVAFNVVFGMIVFIGAIYTWERLKDPRKFVRVGTSWTWIVIYSLLLLTIYVLLKVRSVDPGLVDRKVWGTSCDMSWYNPIEKKSNLTRRFCRKTNMYKPDRSHYCRATSRLIKRYDHHCIFVDASIGHGNHKFFMLFLLYTSLAALSIGLELLFHGEVLKQARGGATLANIAIFVTCIAVSLAVFLFFIFHVFLITTGYTTVEYSEKRGNLYNGIYYVTPYYVSLFTNYSQIFGPNMLTWLLPTIPDNGEGIYFHNNTDDI